MLLSVLIPVFNEVKTIRQIVDRVQSTPYDKEIIIIDDGSTDGTRDELKKLEASNIKIFLHEQNQGKGAALQTGLRHASGDILLIQDADMEYDPSDYPKLLEPIQSGKADVVFGSRFLGAGSHRVLYFWHSLGNRFLTLLANMLNDLNMTDMETGYKVFTKEVQKAIPIRSNVLDLNLNSRQKWRAIISVFMKFRSLIMEGDIRKEKKLHGETVLRRFFGSFVIVSLIKLLTH